MRQELTLVLELADIQTLTQGHTINFDIAGQVVGIKWADRVAALSQAVVANGHRRGAKPVRVSAAGNRIGRPPTVDRTDPNYRCAACKRVLSQWQGKHAKSCRVLRQQAATKRYGPAPHVTVHGRV